MTESAGKTEVRPVAAATTLLLRDGAAGLEVLMITRPANASFAAGALVFPGGAVDAGDREAALHQRCAAVPGLDAAALTFRIAAIRETFEEAGILLARRPGAAGLLPAEELTALQSAAQARLGRAPGLADLLAQAGAQAGLELAVDALVPFAHWITPADRPKRFDTHFYLAAAPLDQVAAHDGEEAVESVWITPEAAVGGGDAGRISLVLATRLNLLRLGLSADVGAALAAARAAPIVTVLPTLTQTPSGTVFRIPEEAGYGIAEVPAGLTRRP